MSVDTYELEVVASLPEKYQAWAPSLAERQSLQVGSFARLFVWKNGTEQLTPWVTVVAVTARGSYVGEVGGVANSPDWRPYGTCVAFTAENVIEI